MLRLSLVALLLFSAGCHAKFKKHAAGLGAVRPQVVHLTGPTVVLGGLDAEDGAPGEPLVEAVTGIAQQIRGEMLADRLARAVDTEVVDTSLVVALDETLGSGPPFALTDDPSAPLLQLELTNYGLYVPTMGAQGRFEYQIRARIFLPDGTRVYTTHQSCSVPAGQPSPLARATNTVDNFRQIRRMSDAQITQAFAVAAETCGAALTARIRRHAG